MSRQTTSVHYIEGRSNANVLWIFLEIPPGICLIKFVDTLPIDGEEKYVQENV